MFNGIKKVAAFFAHSDDEMICAGTLHRLVRQGCRVEMVTFSPAALAIDRMGGQLSADRLLPEWQKSRTLMGVSGRYCPMAWWNPSARLADHGQDICQYVYDYCEIEKPDLAIILSPHDENTAHATVGIECERVMRGRVPNVWRCLFPWNYGKGDNPNLYVTLDNEDMAVKAAVIDAYQSQHFRYNYRDMLLNYAIADGLSVKVAAAEKFEIVRSVV